VKAIGLCAAVVLALVASAGLTAFAGGGPIIHAHSAAARVIRLAERGDVKSAAVLGQMYSTGRGVPQDYFEAAKWFYRAADRGDPRAQFELGVLYNKGRGVRRDYVLAEMWLNLSASRAIGADRDFVVRMRDAVASKMTPEQLAAAQRLALAWHNSQ
jgi:uncharacterized protein